MRKSIHTKYTKVFVLLGFLAASVSACSSEKGYEKPKPMGDDLLPFAIGFTKSGAPLIIDANGNRVEPEKIEFPLETKALERIDNITVLQIRGSHYKLFKLGNSYFKIPLPH